MSRIEHWYWRGWNPRWWLVCGYVDRDGLSQAPCRMLRCGPIGLIIRQDVAPEDQERQE